MPDRPTDSADLTPSGEVPARSLSEILTELAQLSQSQQGDASEMRSAVSELSRSLARLFEMIRTDRHEQRARIAQLERELTAMRLQLAELGVEPAPAPAPNDFDQLRAAAERLRLRTQQLVQDAGTPPADPEAETPEEAGEPLVGSGLGPGAPASRDDGSATEADETVDEPDEPTAREPTPLPEVGVPVLRVIDGDVPSAPAPVKPEVEVEAEPEIEAGSGDSPELDVETDLPLAQEEALPVPPARAADRAPAVEEAEEAKPPVAASVRRPEPVPVAPRPATKRRKGMRRRRVDARKLTGVEPTAALGSMLGAVNQLWTAGCPVNLVIAFTDGGAVRIVGGDRVPLRLEEVEPGTSARCTVTATRRQLIPLFGRLELTDEDSAPLIHGSRRDADLLVGWFDRAQRLPVAPL
ncbi:MAG: hypothetical protein J7513_10695 [Solirubrobacteraceae bacterium]|nr:hypothetical protein [Solirubrobacteraceae bacterium]